MKSTIRTLIFIASLLSPMSAFAVSVNGIYSGTFINPVPPSPPSVTTGFGTSTITWGVPCDGVTNCFLGPGGAITPPSSFAFTPISFTTEIDQPFVLGEIEFFNGTIFPGTEISSATLALDSFQITPTQFAGSDIRVISIVNTPNSSDPIASADRATIPMATFPAANVFGVLESQSATATLLGKFTEVSPNSLDLNILGFSEPTSHNGFLEDFADPPGGGNPIPEPSTIVLLGSGLGTLGLWRMRQQRK
ncbi:MAG: hypothetical protein NPIRA02_14060 [Nitrospirales bacterium]|nr:MAG: hypothetical protein NPIRA02_14060 [Nitrospirales bacterium]